MIAIIPTADRQKATVKVRVGFEKLDPRLLPQMGVKVAFQSNKPAEIAADGRGTLMHWLDGRYVNDKLRRLYDGGMPIRTQVQVSLGVNRDLSAEPHWTTWLLDERGRRIGTDIASYTDLPLVIGQGAADDAVQIHGAYGYSDEYNVERHLRNSKSAVIYEGTREVHTLLQAEYALGYRKDKQLSHPQPPAQGFDAVELLEMTR